MTGVKELRVTVPAVIAKEGLIVPVAIRVEIVESEATLMVKVPTVLTCLVETTLAIVTVPA